MMRMKTKATGLPYMNGGGGGGGGSVGGGSEGSGGGGSDGGDWEMRPGGMLVQKRNPDSDPTAIPPPTIRVRVKYGSIYHQIHISSQASFGELKKMLTGPTGLHHQDQKLMYKDKERDSNAFLDRAGVKDRSKMVLVEDPISKEKRFLEMRKNAKMEKASKTISEISLEVDRLAGQVSALETIILRGAKVVEKDVLNVIESLMNQLIKLDGIIADGDVKLQRKMQVKRVQKYVETLDMLKVKNSTPSSNGNQTPNSNGNQTPNSNGNQTPNSNGNHVPSQNQQKYTNGQRSVPIQQQPPRHSVGQQPIINTQHQQQQLQQPSRHSTPGVVVTTKWETFDSAPAALVPMPLISTSASPTVNPNHHKFNWELFE